MAIYIGIDLGTSGCRGIAIDEDARICAEAKTAIPLPLRKGNFIEQDPDVWWQATQRVLKDIATQIDPGDVKSIAVDGTSSTVVMCDDKGRPSYSAIMYSDARAKEEAARIKQYALKDTAAHGATSSLAKLLWLENQGIASRSQLFMHQTDWVTAHLNGRFGNTDENNAIKLGYDPVHGKWPEWMDKLRVPKELLPKVVKPGSIVGTLKFELTERFNFPITTQIIAGTTDSTAAFLSTGASEIGDASTSLGSSMVLKILADKPIFEPAFGIYSQPLGNRWLVGGASNTGGAVLQKFFSQEQIDELTMGLKPGVYTDLNYYPLFSKGERFPVNDPEMMPKVTPRPVSDVEFFQGLLEGMAAIEQKGYEKLNELGAPRARRIFTTGRGAANEGWTTIRSFELDIPIVKSRHIEAAYGSALLARKGSINVTANLKSFQ